MYTIGDFAKHGRVSVRMLRHYDAVGLLRPARVDPASGYRLYTARQLSRLNRIIALKELGFTLQQVGAILDDRVSTEQLQGMLRLRRAELTADVAAAAARLAQVEARLRAIESEGRMPATDVVIKAVPAVRIAELSATAAGYAPEEIGPVITPLYQELFRRLAEAGVTPAGPGVAWYEDAPEGDGAVTVHAGVTVTAEPRDDLPFAVVDLPGIETAATAVHRGPMDQVVSTDQVVARWLDSHGYRSAGYAREVYLECPQDPADWVTEIQVPVVPGSAS